MSFDKQRLLRLPKREQDRFERITNEIIIESFIFMGDRDYLAARFAFFQGQPHLFLWSAAQAIEKYIKANIALLTEEPVKKTHKLVELAGTLRRWRPERLNISTSIPDGWLEQGVSHWPDAEVDDFLARLQECGSPAVRYDQVKLFLRLQDLVFLDRLAFGLRDRLVVEPVDECKDVSEVLRAKFFDLNVSFAPPGYNHPSLRGVTICRSKTTKLEVALNGYYGFRDIYREWAKNRLSLTADDIERVLNDREVNG